MSCPSAHQCHKQGGNPYFYSRGKNILQQTEYLEPHNARINRRENVKLLSFKAGVINFMDVVDAIPVYHSNLIIYAFSSHANLLQLIMKLYPTRW